MLAGTFDPVHWGHLLLAETALNQFQLNQILWIPTRYPPHKQHFSPLNLEHRLSMVRMAIADHPNFALAEIERQRTCPSYALTILQDLQQNHSPSHWFWILGLDAFQRLPRWYGRQELAKTCDWLVAPRRFSDPVLPLPEDQGFPVTGTERDRMQQSATQVQHQMLSQAIAIRWSFLSIPAIDISSSLIRQYCGDRRSIRYLVPDPVRDYITDQKLYQPK